jgi:hypothetical protein
MVSKPLALSDAQMDAVMSAAAPLTPVDRDQFLRALADALRDAPHGDGTVAKTIRHIVRAYFRPPEVPRETVYHRRNIGPPIPDPFPLASPRRRAPDRQPRR